VIRIHELLSRIVAALHVLLHGTREDETVVKELQSSEFYRFWESDPAQWSQEDLWKRYALSENLFRAYVLHPLPTLSIDEIRRLWVLRTVWVVGSEALRRERDQAQKDLLDVVTALAAADIAAAVSRDN
jgi:hypothetical protein